VALALLSTVDDNQSWVTLIDERELTFLWDKLLFKKEVNPLAFQYIGLMSRDM